MSRSNSPAVPPGGHSARPPRQLNQPLPHQPQAQPGAGDQLSQFRQPQHRQQQTYAPQFDPYAAPAQPAPYAQQPSQQGYSNPQAYEQPQAPVAQSGLTPPSPYATQAGYTQPSTSTGYAQLAATAYAQPNAQARQPSPSYDQWAAPAPAHTPDPRGYDHGGYSAAQSHDGYASQGYQTSTDWGQGGQQYGHGGQEPSLDPSAYHPDQQAYQQAGGQDPNAEYAEDEEYEDDAAPRGKFMRIAAALVGAIVVGGGLAYAYTSLVAPGNGSPPVIKSAGGPNKIKPADAGGKKFANTEKKLMGQLNDGASSGDPDLSGVKRVGTVQVAADGTIMPPAEKPVDAAKVAADGSFPNTGATASGGASDPAAATASADAPVTVTPPQSVQVAAAQASAEPVKPSIVSSTTTSSINPPPAPAKPAAEAAAAPPAPPPVKKVAVATPAAVTAQPAAKKPAAAPVTAAPSGAAGYVAVLASVPVSTTSRINALKQFADMQQQYSTVLQNKTPDVKEANLGEKGNYHRLLVGPPSSREGAQALCGSLKAAGYANDCWVTAY